MQRVAALFCWAMLVWVLLTWTFTLEQILFGVGIAAAVALSLAPLGGVARPWRLLHPRRLAAVAALMLLAAGRIVVANVRLALRIWAPSRPLRSGMVLAATCERSPGGITAVGLTTSLIVDNQLVDLDLAAHRLQYHAVAIPDGDPWRVREAINAPVERIIPALEDGRQAER